MTNSCACYRTTPDLGDYCPCCNGHTTACGFASHEVWLSKLATTKPHRAEYRETTHEREVANELAGIEAGASAV